MEQMTELKVPKNTLEKQQLLYPEILTVTQDNPDLVVSSIIEEVQSTKTTDEYFCFLSLTELPRHDQSVA